MEENIIDLTKTINRRNYMRLIDEEPLYTKTQDIIFEWDDNSEAYHHDSMELYLVVKNHKFRVGRAYGSNDKFFAVTYTVDTYGFMWNDNWDEPMGTLEKAKELVMYWIRTRIQNLKNQGAW